MNLGLEVKWYPLNLFIFLYTCIQFNNATTQNPSFNKHENDQVELFDNKIYDKQYLEGLTNIHLYLDVTKPIPEFITSISTLTTLKISFYLQPSLLNQFKTFDLQKHKQLSSNDCSIGDQENNHLINDIAELQLCALKGIDSIKNLRVLDISNNFLQDIPESVAKMKNLKNLDVSRNSLRYLKDEIIELESLEYLNISHNSLLNGCCCLYTHESPLVHYPGMRQRCKCNRTYKKITGLKYLDMSSCSIQKIDPKIFEIESLVTLDLSCNSLSFIPSDISRLKSLKTLNISNNCNLSELRAPYERNKEIILPSIETLDISLCSFGSIPSYSMPNLLTLKASYNKLCDFSAETLKLMPLLENLDISSNKFLSILDNLAYLEKLKSLKF